MEVICATSRERPSREGVCLFLPFLLPDGWNANTTARATVSNLRQMGNICRGD